MIRRLIPRAALVCAAVAVLAGCLTVQQGNGYDRYETDPCCPSLTFWPEATQAIKEAVANGGSPSAAVQISDWQEGQEVWSWIDGHNIGDVHGLIRSLDLSRDQRLWISWAKGYCGGTCYNVGVVG